VQITLYAHVRPEQVFLVAAGFARQQMDRGRALGAL
jgi:hypothetical protein